MSAPPHWNDLTVVAYYNFTNLDADGYVPMRRMRRSPRSSESRDAMLPDLLRTKLEAARPLTAPAEYQWEQWVERGGGRYPNHGVLKRSVHSD